MIENVKFIIDCILWIYPIFLAWGVMLVLKNRKVKIRFMKWDDHRWLRAKRRAQLHMQDFPRTNEKKLLHYTRGLESEYQTALKVRRAEEYYLSLERGEDVSEYLPALEAQIKLETELVEEDGIFTPEYNARQKAKFKINAKSEWD